MDAARVRLGFELSGGIEFSLGEATSFLQTQQFDPEKAYYEFLISGKPTPDSVRALLTLPYEIALTEQERRIVLSTGERNSTGSEVGYVYRRCESRLNFHTHPDFEGEVHVNTPSFNDVYATGCGATKYALAHPGGLMIYTIPRLDPWNVLVRSDYLDILLDYGQATRVNLFNFRSEQGYKPYSDFSEEEQVSYQRHFAEQSGMIVDEAQWEDGKGIERVLAKIFRGINQR